MPPRASSAFMPTSRGRKVLTAKDASLIKLAFSTCLIARTAYWLGLVAFQFAPSACETIARN
jgi:hypothetical protein